MRFLADESCDFAVVRALRAAGHDVVAIAEISPRATDEGVLEHAIRWVILRLVDVLDVLGTRCSKVRRRNWRGQEC
ncbi:MAG: DUF5615 family PIN-like protein [Candidatus Rokubacteria bacterium]|nr:DUF5615 family PIN-like protein [Candidatus Rokubacteria bacterium]